MTMTQQEAAAELIAGSRNTNSYYVTVLREQLLLALGAGEADDDRKDDLRGHGEPDLDAAP